MAKAKSEVLEASDDVAEVAGALRMSGKPNRRCRKGGGGGGLREGAAVGWEGVGGVFGASGDIADVAGALAHSREAWERPPEATRSVDVVLER